MSTVGPNLGLLDNGGYGEGVYSETLRLYRALDLLVQAVVISMAETVPPLTPSEGDAYIIPSGAMGEWADKVGQIARWTSRQAVLTPQWEYFIPRHGWKFNVTDIGCEVKFSGSSWSGSGFVVSTTPPDDNDGRPDGTLYFQVV